METLMTWGGSSGCRVEFVSPGLSVLSLSSPSISTLVLWWINCWIIHQVSGEQNRRQASVWMKHARNRVMAQWRPPHPPPPCLPRQLSLPSWINNDLFDPLHQHNLMWLMGKSCVCVFLLVNTLMKCCPWKGHTCQQGHNFRCWNSCVLK